MLAYIHIEKAAGQTFIRILENNFVYRHCRVAPLRKEHDGVFKWTDLRLLLKVNPFLQALAGHSIVPYSDLSAFRPDIQYITVLRNPVERYLSHYQYWIQALNKNISFEEFLMLEDLMDFQTKKIAGTTDLPAAKRIVKEKIFLAGILDEFDEFLAVLQKKLAPQSFDIAYKRRNVARSNSIKKEILKKFERYRGQIEKNNRLDMELYDYVKNTIFKVEKQTWLENVAISAPDMSQGSIRQDLKKTYIGKLYRNLYMGPIINLIRYCNGLKIGGSY